MELRRMIDGVTYRLVKPRRWSHFLSEALAYLLVAGLLALLVIAWIVL
jgi:hypothetical protein